MSERQRGNLATEPDTRAGRHSEQISSVKLKRDFDMMKGDVTAGHSAADKRSGMVAVDLRVYQISGRSSWSKGHRLSKVHADGSPK